LIDTWDFQDVAEDDLKEKILTLFTEKCIKVFEKNDNGLGKWRQVSAKVTKRLSMSALSKTPVKQNEEWLEIIASEAQQLSNTQ
jgi:hypothetical protein